MDTRLGTFLLLTLSNVFMTFAWYGHLKFRELPLWKVILASWGLALFEYILQVPANRMGYGAFSAFQLKIMQEVISLVVFIVFARLFLQQDLQWRHLVSFALIIGAVVVAFQK